MVPLLPLATLMTAISTFSHPSLNVGDFHCHHVNWDCSKTFLEGESLDSWATANRPWLLYDPKWAASFSSHRWNVGTNADLAFASVGQDNQLMDRRFGKVPTVTTPTLAHNAIEAQSSCLQRSGKALEISQGLLKALLPSRRWICWEIATSEFNKDREGIPSIFREPAVCG